MSNEATVAADRVADSIVAAREIHLPAPVHQPTSSDMTTDPGDIITIIEPRTNWSLATFVELWNYKELFYFLTWRDIKVRYKQTVLGASWAVLQPLATMIVFSIFFGRVANMSSGDLPYPLFVLGGLLPWYFFANSVTSAAQSIVGNQTLVTKVYFPRIIIPTSAVCAGIVDFGIAMCLLVPMLFYYGVMPDTGLLWLPLILIGLILLTTAVGTLLAALTVTYRDFRHVVPFMIQLWLFATPAIYLSAADTFGPFWQVAVKINPMYGLITNFRAATIGGPFDLPALGLSLIATVVLLAVSLWYFRHVERGFADII